MATEKTNYTNVFRDTEVAEKNSNTKNPVVYDMDFDGSEFVKWQPESFEAFGKTTRMNSAELSRKIYAHFKQTFHELRGVNIIILPNAQIAVEMFFERNTEALPDGKIMNLDCLVDPVGSGAKRNMYESMQVVQNRFHGNTYELNKETKLLLAKYMYGGVNANLPNNKKVWGDKAVHREVHIPVTDQFRRAYNTDRIMIRVSGLDIRRILQELYGKDIVTKTVVNEADDVNYRSEARYEVRFIKANVDGTFVMNIEQFDSAAVEKIFMQENPMPQQYLGIQMYNN